jgi:hypothetical protein
MPYIWSQDDGGFLQFFACIKKTLELLAKTKGGISAMIEKVQYRTKSSG